MKILQINKLYYPQIGGIETVVKNIAEHLQTDVLVCQKKGKRKINNNKGITIYRAASWGTYLSLPLSLDFFKLAKKIIPQYDIIIIHHPFPLALFLSSLLKKKRVYFYYHSDIIRQRISKIFFLPFLYYNLRQAEKIIVSGHNIIKSSPILKKYQDKCIVIPFGLDLEKYKIDEEIKKESKKIKEQFSSPLLLSIGRLVSYKGFQYLIPALKNISAHLLIIGEGKEEKKLKQLITKYHLKKQVTIISHVSNLKPYYLASDLFIFPSISRNEAFGLVQLEAMYYSLPIINTIIHTAVEEVSVNNVTGLSVIPKNTEKLHQAIKTLLNNPELKTKMGQKAHQRVIDKYNNDLFISSLKKLYFNGLWQNHQS